MAASRLYAVTQYASKIEPTQLLPDKFLHLWMLLLNYYDNGLLFVAEIKCSEMGKRKIGQKINIIKNRIYFSKNKYRFERTEQLRSVANDKTCCV